MPPLDTVLIVLAASAVLNAVPGPSNLYVLSRSVAQGRCAGLVSALGLATGAFGHVLAAAVGLTAVFAYSPVAFQVVKYLGAGYLIYLGIKTLRGRSSLTVITRPLPKAPAGRLFLQGVVTEILNPKTALFFLSFLPQFAEPSGGSLTLQLAVLGLLVPLTALPLDLLVALAGGAIARISARAPLLRGLQRWSAGTLLIGIGVRVAISDRR